MGELVPEYRHLWSVGDFFHTRSSNPPGKTYTTKSMLLVPPLAPFLYKRGPSRLVMGLGGLWK